MTEGKKRPAIEERLAALESECGRLRIDIRHMQQAGGHVDTRTLSKRCTRIEQRLEKVERPLEKIEAKASAAFASIALLCSAIADHLRDRHGANLVTDQALDFHSVRQARQIMRAAGEGLAQLEKRVSA
jgi:hypothetical protein